MKHWMLLVMMVLICLVLPGRSFAQAENWRHRVTVESPTDVKEDIAEELRFGREVAARMIGRFSLYDNKQLTRYVSLVGQSLVQNGNRPEIEYHFAVLNTDVINAFAAPGGYVFVTRGAIAKMQDESELAAVLAHEITHINEKHVVKELNIRGAEGSAAAGMARLIGGGTESARVAFTQAVDKAMDMLFTTGYKREDEVQADKGAVILCALTGYDPAGLIRYFQRIGGAKGAATEILDKTHPSYEARINLLKETISREGIESSSLRTFKDRLADAQKTIK